MRSPHTFELDETCALWHGSVSAVVELLFGDGGDQSVKFAPRPVDGVHLLAKREELEHRETVGGAILLRVDRLGLFRDLVLLLELHLPLDIILDELDLARLQLRRSGVAVVHVVCEIPRNAD